VLLTMVLAVSALGQQTTNTRLVGCDEMRATLRVSLLVVVGVGLPLAVAGAGEDDWFLHTPSVSQFANDIHFCDPYVGVYGGWSGVFLSEDGGLSWESLPIPPIQPNDPERKPRHGWYRVRCASPTEFWAFGQIHPGGIGQTNLGHSTDGGQTWEIGLEGKTGHATDLKIWGEEHVWVLCRGDQSFYSADGGQTWEAMQVPGQYLHQVLDLIPVGPGQAYICAGRAGETPQGVLLRFEGVELAEEIEIPGAGPLRRGCFISPEHGWVAEHKKNLFATEDGGKTWLQLPLPGQANQGLNDLEFLSARRGWAAFYIGFDYQAPTAPYTLFETTDGGQTWQPCLGGMRHISSIFFLDPQHGWLSGGLGGAYGSAVLIGIYEGE